VAPEDPPAHGPVQLFRHKGEILEPCRELGEGAIGRTKKTKTTWQRRGEALNSGERRAGHVGVDVLSRASNEIDGQEHFPIRNPPGSFWKEGATTSVSW